MDLEDKATQGVNVELYDDLYHSVYVLNTTELVAADELTGEDDFPYYGDFLAVDEYSPVDDTYRGESYIIVPRDLARWLVDQELGEGDAFQVDDLEKRNGEWIVSCSVKDAPDPENPE